MNSFETVTVFLLALVRVLLFGLVIWMVVREIRRSGRTRKKKDS